MITETFVLTAAASAPPGTYIGAQPPTIGNVSPAKFLTFDIKQLQQNLGGSPSTLTLAVDSLSLAQDAFTSITIRDTEDGDIALDSEDATFSVAGPYASWTWDLETDDPIFLVATEYSVEIVRPGVQYNCECDDELGDSYPTLETLRGRMMVRLGYAAQKDNPPPGMADLLNDFLQSAQTVLYQKHKELRTERFFTWTMAVGERFYDIPDNEEACTKRLDALKLSWVGIEDLNGTWLPLASGIRPENYTMATQNGLPQVYEIRQCIEVFPAPDQAYKLRIKGHFLLSPFADDEDQTSINGELVFLWALANAKNHYGKGDASAVKAEANALLGDLKNGRHGTRRYIPCVTPEPAMTKPVFLPLVTP